MPTIHTIGHSTRPIEEFIDLLREFGITTLVDIRTIPRSRHNPQYEQEALKQSLPKAGITYVHLTALGGLRNKADTGLNDGWRNASFRNFADYMQTPAFEEGLGELLGIAQKSPTAIMCAEAVPWRCHRSLVADALDVRGVPVIEILSERDYRPHELTPFARIEGASITYPPDQAALF